MEQYLIDNNAISNYFSGNYTYSGVDFMEEVFDLIPNISVITEIEAMSWVNPDKSKELIINSFVQDSNVLPLTKSIVSKCIEIRRSKKIKTPDAIMAATAIVHNFTLFTSDSDFNHISGLKIIDPHSL